jgi:hypothetical protein
MAKFGIPDKFIAIIRSFHEGMQASVSVEGEASNSFQVSNGVKQGCVLAPTLFSIMFSGMLKIAFQDNTDAIAIDWRTDGEGYLPSQDSGLKQECITTLFEIFYLQTTVPSTLTQ